MHTSESSFHSQLESKSGLAEIKPVRLIRLPEVRHLTGLSRTQIYRLEARGDFVKRIKLGDGPASATAWLETSVLQWIADRIAASQSATA
ncbi:hypothetical protein B0E46_13755 [Rhodanobacter sp. B04]|uniref:helix-turn-helix transcriptional regulator n=1 Tax=Rhodanobacter sp. B04 TaxID=1945860 RepID=UPI000984D6A7|nr:AlpA family transcriptional regulator [Rhodanobacter sp. B04]OOG62054.1 hypothetical protein B0E46_13755 [Rhodanobacter sp. B04]